MGNFKTLQVHFKEPNVITIRPCLQTMKSGDGYMEQLLSHKALMT